MKTIQFIKKYLKGDGIKLIGSFFFAIADAFLMLVPPLIFSFFVDYVLSDPNTTDSFNQQILQLLGGREFLQQNLWIGGLIILTTYFLLGTVGFLRGYFGTKVAEGISYRIRNDLYEHIQHMTFETLSKLKTGDIIQRCTSDIDQIRRVFATQLTYIFSTSALAIFAGSILFSIHFNLGLISLISIPILIFYAYSFFVKTQKAFEVSDEAEAELTTLVQESLSGIRVVKAFNREQFEMKRFAEKNENYRKKTYYLIKLLGQYYSSSDILCSLQIAVSVVCGIYFTVNGEISVGDLLVFISYIGSILWPIRHLGRVLSDVGKSTVSVKRLQEVFDTEKEDLYQGEMIEFKGKIEFSNVGFTYPNATEKLFENLSFSVNPGETVAILGPTGSGKSTLIYLLLRFLEYNKGNIRIDGKELSDLSRHCVRSQIGVVMQEPFLFSKTILENIRLSKDKIAQSDIENATHLASVHHVITEFDQQYETFVGEKGVTLSGGQKQRVAIARTLLKKTPILVLDDSLSAVDSETDKKIRTGLQNMDYNPTKIIITQRIASAMSADQILVIENGEITQRGKHEDLIQEDGLYRRVYDIQKLKIEGEVDR